MTKQEERKKNAVAEAEKLFESMTREQANQYFTDNLTMTQITKAHMAAYLKKFATTKEEQEWYKGDFYKASFEIVKRKEDTICTDANGEIIYKLNKEHRVIPKSIRVDSKTGETYARYSIIKARKAFIEHFNITPKNSKFKPKAKRVEDRYDEFDGLFPKRT